MTAADRDIRIFILKALLRAKGPMNDSALRDAIRNSFSHIAMTAGEIAGHISGAEETGLISGTNDDVFGLMWDMTAKGKIKIQQA